MTIDSTASATQSTRQRFAVLLEQHRRIVFKVAATYCRDADDRADLAQEIAAQLWRAFPGYDASRPFPTWMYRIALNVAISHLRERELRQRHIEAFDESLHDRADDNATDPAAEQQLRMLHGFIAQLGALDRALLLLYLDDHRQAQIADILGISESNVATKIGRLKQRIRNHIPS